MTYTRTVLTPYTCVLFTMLAAWECDPDAQTLDETKTPEQKTKTPEQKTETPEQKTKTPEQKQKIMMAALNSPEGKEAFNEVVCVMDKTLRPIHTSENIEILYSSMDPFYKYLEQYIKHFFLCSIEEFSRCDSIVFPSRESLLKKCKDQFKKKGKNLDDGRLFYITKANKALYEVILRDFIKENTH